MLHVCHEAPRQGNQSCECAATRGGRTVVGRCPRDHPTRAEAARPCSMSERSIWSRIAGGRLVVTRVGRITLVCVASIHALLDAPSAAPGKVAPRAVDAPWETEAFGGGLRKSPLRCGKCRTAGAAASWRRLAHRSHRPCWAELPPPPNCETDNDPREDSDRRRDDERRPRSELAMMAGVTFSHHAARNTQSGFPAAQRARRLLAMFTIVILALGLSQRSWIRGAHSYIL